MCIKIQIKVCIFKDKSILNLIYVTEKNFYYMQWKFNTEISNSVDVEKLFLDLIIRKGSILTRAFAYFLKITQLKISYLRLHVP